MEASYGKKEGGALSKRLRLEIEEKNIAHSQSGEHLNQEFAEMNGGLRSYHIL